MRRTTDDESEIFPIRGDGRRLWRLVHSGLTDEDDWRSHYERGDPPRRSEVVSALSHMSLSMWDRVQPLHVLSKRYPRQLGTYIVAIDAFGELGLWLAATGPEGHFSVWGRPADLQRSAQLPARPV